MCFLKLLKLSVSMCAPREGKTVYQQNVFHKMAQFSKAKKCSLLFFAGSFLCRIIQRVEITKNRYPFRELEMINFYGKSTTRTGNAPLKSGYSWLAIFISD